MAQDIEELQALYVFIFLFFLAKMSGSCASLGGASEGKAYVYVGTVTIHTQ